MRHVGVVAVAINDHTRGHHLGDLFERRQVGEAEHLAKRAAGREVQVLGFEDRSEDGVDALAHRTQSFPVFRYRERLQQLVDRASPQTAARRRRQALDVKHLEDRIEMQHGLGLQPPLHVGVRRHLRRDQLPHAAHAREQRHEAGHRTQAVGDDLHVFRAGGLAHVVEGGRPVARGDVVDRELRLRDRKVRTRAVVEQPGVVALLAEVLGEVSVEAVEGKDVGRVAEAGRADDRALGAACEPN